MRQFVGVILVADDGSVLAQHRDDNPNITGPNTWCVLGGAREEGDEDLRFTGARELEEETDYVIDPNELQFLTSDVYTSEKNIVIERTIFWARYDGVQPINCHEGQEIRFVHPSELPELNIYMGHREFLTEAVSRK